MAKELIKDIYKVRKVSKNGDPYDNLVIEFLSGYTVKLYINNEQSFCMSDVPVRE